MPHDKYGKILKVGDQVILRGVVLSINPTETQCNITVEAAERPEGEGYIPQIGGNSRFYEKVIPPFQQRVIDEKAELDSKLEKLRAFFDTATFAALPDEEKARLCLQSGSMADYSAILGQRIDAFA